jgi:hypothetical protein
MSANSKEKIRMKTRINNNSKLSTLATIYEANNTVDTFKSLINSAQPLSSANQKKLNNIFRSMNKFNSSQLATRFDDFLLNSIEIQITPEFKSAIFYYFDSGKVLNARIKVEDLRLIKNTFIKFLNYKKINNAEISKIKGILEEFTANSKKPSPVVVEQSNENRARAAGFGYSY